MPVIEVSMACLLLHLMHASSPFQQQPLGVAPPLFGVAVMMMSLGSSYLAGQSAGASYAKTNLVLASSIHRAA